MSTDDENEKQSLDDAIERLEAEHRRRIDEKIERGEAVRSGMADYGWRARPRKGLRRSVPRC